MAAQQSTLLSPLGLQLVAVWIRAEPWQVVPCWGKESLGWAQAVWCSQPHLAACYPVFLDRLCPQSGSKAKTGSSHRLLLMTSVWIVTGSTHSTIYVPNTRLPLWFPAFPQLGAHLETWLWLKRNKKSMQKLKKKPHQNILILFIHSYVKSKLLSKSEGIGVLIYFECFCLDLGPSSAPSTEREFMVPSCLILSKAIT